MPEASQFLGPPMTANYRPAVLGYGMIQSLYTGQVPLFMLGEVEAMRSDPQIQLGIAILRAPLHRLKWQVKSPHAGVRRFVDAMFRKVWQSSLRKLLHYVEYGNAAGEPLYKEEGGWIVFDQLRDVYPRDAVPLMQKGGVVGIQVKGGPPPIPQSNGKADATGQLNLFPPRAFWVAHRPRNASPYGYSRYQGAWWPWLEKRGRHGATDVRRLWYIKNAYRGGSIRHPPGVMERPDGTLVSCQDYAREILEKAETGGVLALPNAKDPNTAEYLWVYEPAAVNGDLTGVREYARDLDDEILQGIEIPPEVARAAETGSGWSGRSVPFLVFLSGEDELAAELIQAITLWILRPLVAVNFGAAIPFVIEPVSLTELLGQADGNNGNGSEGEQPGQPTPAAPPAVDRPRTAQRIQLSLEEPDRGSRESSSSIVDQIIEQGSGAGVIAADEIRRRIRSLVKKKLPEAELIDEARSILAEYEPILAAAFSDSLLAGWLAGAARATRDLPPMSAPGLEGPSLAPPGPPLTAPLGADDLEPFIRLPLIESAAGDLGNRRIVTREQFDQLSAEARATAFTAARVASEEALARLAQALSENVGQGGTLRDFAAAVDEALGEGALSPGHIENVYRTNVAQAYSTGLLETLAHPLVADEFRYLLYSAVHDSRVRHDHLALEKLGLDGTAVYRRDDPIWEQFTPPWDYQCRCTIIPLSVEDAAAYGVREARDWLSTGMPPASPEWVTPPPFSPPAGWSLRPAVRLSEDAQGHQHDKLGRFAPKGQGGSAASKAPSKATPPSAGGHRSVLASGKAQKELRRDVQQMASTRAGRQTLARGKAVAAKVKSGIAKGVGAALDAIDQESKGGISLLAGALASRSPTMAAAGAAHLFNSVFQCVHEEVFENALSQHSIPGAHAVGMVASSLAVKAEQGMLKAVGWALGKVTKRNAVRMSLDEDRDPLTAADQQLLKLLSRVVARGVRQVYAAAGVPAIAVNLPAIEQRLATMLRTNAIRLSLDAAGHAHDRQGLFTAKGSSANQAAKEKRKADRKDYKEKRKKPTLLVRRIGREMLHHIPMRPETDRLIDAVNEATDLLPADPIGEHRRRLDEVRKTALATIQRLQVRRKHEEDSEEEHRALMQRIKQMALWAHKAEKRLAALEQHPGKPKED